MGQCTLQIFYFSRRKGGILRKRRWVLHWSELLTHNYRPTRHRYLRCRPSRLASKMCRGRWGEFYWACKLPLVSNGCSHCPSNYAVCAMWSETKNNLACHSLASHLDPFDSKSPYTSSFASSFHQSERPSQNLRFLPSLSFFQRHFSEVFAVYFFDVSFKLSGSNLSCWIKSDSLF